MKNPSYYIAPVGDWTHDLPHTVASNMVKMYHALNHSATVFEVSSIEPNSRIYLYIYYIHVYMYIVDIWYRTDIRLMHGTLKSHKHNT